MVFIREISFTVPICLMNIRYLLYMLAICMCYYLAFYLGIFALQIV